MYTRVHIQQLMHSDKGALLLVHH